MKVQFFHVLLQNNVEADEMANTAINKAQGILGVDGHEHMESPP